MRQKMVMSKSANNDKNIKMEVKWTSQSTKEDMNKKTDDDGDILTLHDTSTADGSPVYCILV